MEIDRTPAPSRRTLGTLVTAALLAAGLAVAGSGTSAHAGPAASPRAAYDQACRYYENRARFLPRDGRVDLVVLLAEGCRAARRSYVRGSEVERRAAAFFLSRIVRLRDTIIEINVTRIYGKNPHRRAMPRTAEGRLQPLGTVSGTGEYLIAREMGLLRALEDWRTQADDFPLALR